MKQMTKKEAAEVVESLFSEYHEPKCALDFENPLQLLVSSRLSAQCTDVRVNIVTKELFAKYKNVEDYANAKQEDIEKIIFSCGLYRTKARDIIAAAKKLIELSPDFPSTMEGLLEIPGVGRKIANLILGELYGVQDVIIADTHCTRLANRIGLCDSKNPHIVEKELLRLLPKGTGFRFSHSLVTHGRKVCKSQNPDCQNCCISDKCRYFALDQKAAVKNKKTEK